MTDSRRHRAVTPLAGLAAAGSALLLTSGLPGLTGRDSLLLAVASLLALIGCFSVRLSILIPTAMFVGFALIRRLVPAENPTLDPAAIAPFITALPLAARSLAARPPKTTTSLVVWCSASVLLTASTILVGVAGWFNLVVPLLAAASIKSTEANCRYFLRALVAFSTLAFLYGILQFIKIPSWDAAWLQGSDIRFSSGQPGTHTFRPFATFAAPGIGAVVAAVVILLLVSSKGRSLAPPVLRFTSIGLASSYLLLTQVRSAWLALAISLVVLTVSSGRQAGRRAFSLVVGGVLLLQVPALQAVFFPRIQTFANLSSDPSLSARESLLHQLGRFISPIGQGIGTFSTGSRAGTASSLDNGYIVVLAELGVVGFGLFAIYLINIARASRSKDLPFLAMLLLINLAGFGFGNLPGLMLWTLTASPARSTRYSGNKAASLVLSPAIEPRYEVTDRKMNRRLGW